MVYRGMPRGPDLDALLLEAADALSLTLLLVTHDPALLARLPASVDVSAWSAAGPAKGAQ